MTPRPVMPWPVAADAVSGSSADAGAAAVARTRVKICGLTRAGDAEHAAGAGADAIGVVFADSPRRLRVADARRVFAAVPPGVLRVGVFADQPLSEVLDVVAACGLDCVQLCGDEPPGFAAAVPRPVLRAVHVATTADIHAARGYPAAAFLLDAPRRHGRRGGTGTPFDWSAAATLPWPRARVVVAGGLNPENVGDAIIRLRPGGVDVASGVEATPCVKDVARIHAFIAAVRAADARLHESRPAEGEEPVADHD